MDMVVGGRGVSIDTHREEGDALVLVDDDVPPRRELVCEQPAPRLG